MKKKIHKCIREAGYESEGCPTEFECFYCDDGTFELWANYGEYRLDVIVCPICGFQPDRLTRETPEKRGCDSQNSTR